MKYYTLTIKFNCGINFHACQIYTCVRALQGKNLVHTKVNSNDFEVFLIFVRP